MKRLPSIAIGLALFTLGAGAGWSFFGGREAAKPKSLPALPPAPVSLAGRTAAKAGLPGGPDDWIAAVHRAGSSAEQVRAAVALAEALRPEDYRRMLAMADRLPPNSSQEIFASAVLRRWVRTDPRAAAEWCRANASRDFADTVAEWTKADPRAAETFVAALPPTHQSYRALGGFFSQLAETDPAAALAALAAHPQWQGAVLTAGLDRLAQSDPQRLMVLAESLSPGLAVSVRGAAAKALAAGDFKGTMEWIGRQSDSADLFKTVVSAAPDFRAALDACLHMPAHLRGDIRLKYWGDDLIRKDPAAALRACVEAGLDNERTEQPPWMVSSALQALATTDPNEAIRMTSDRGGPWASLWKAMISEAWASMDPGAALKWARTLEPGTLGREVMARLEAAASPPGWDPSPVDRCLAEVGMGLYSQGQFSALQAPDERLAFLDKLARGSQDSQISDFVAEEFRQSYPAEYLEWLARQAPSEECRSKMRMTLADLARNDPAAAAAWLSKRPAADQTPEALSNVASAWSQYDPEAARAWMDGLDAEVRAKISLPGGR